MYKLVKVIRVGLWLLLCGGFGGVPQVVNAAIVMAANGTLWTVDTLNNRIQQRNAAGTVISQFGSYGKAAGQFDAPTIVRIASDGSLWIADGEKTDSGDQGVIFNSYRLQHFKSDGTFIREYGSKGSGLGEFSGISDLAPAKDGSIWVADADNYRVQHFKADGTLIAQFGSFGGGAGQFSYYLVMALAADGSVWVADQNNNRLQHFTADGRFISQFGSFGINPGQFENLVNLTVAADGSVWVNDISGSRLQHFKENGTFIAQFGDLGNVAGPLDAQYYFDVSLDGKVWVVANNGIQPFDAQNAQFSFVNPADFNDQQATLYIHDVEVNNQHYEAVLQQQGGNFGLLSAGLTARLFQQGSNFDSATNIVNIPIVYAYGKYYQVTLKHLGNFVFQLQTATPL